MSVKIKTKLCAKKGTNDFREIAMEKLADFIEENKYCHEVIEGPCVPYYDFEQYYATEELQKKNFYSDFEESQAKVLEKFGNEKKARVYSFDSSGKTNNIKHKNQPFKNSFHF